MHDVSMHVIDVTADESGDFTGETVPVRGRVLQLRYVPESGNALDTGADLDIVTSISGVVIANHDDIGTAAFTKAYLQPTHGADGTANVFGADAVLTWPYVGGEKLTLTIANGGNGGQGKFYIYVG